MSRQSGRALVLLAILAGSPGCVSCASHGYGLAVEAGPNCDVPEFQRNQTYIFAVSSLNPAGILALETLRTKLNEQGFAKVATGQVWHTPWMLAEMRRITATNPEAVFVILGCEAGSPKAVRLVENALAQNLPVAGVVLLDADGKTTAPRLGVRTLTVGSGYGSAATTGLESIVVPDVGRISLLTDARTVEAVTRLLNEVAMTIPVPSPVITTGWDYPQAPEDRPIIPIGSSLEWSYLFDQPGSRVTAIGDPLISTATRPAPLSTPTVRRP